MMQQRPDFQFINSVESVLISNKQPTKLLSDTKCLVESKHVEETQSYKFTTPSEDCLSKLQKICPIQPKSAGKDSNANLRAFIVITLQSVFSSQDDFYENLLIQKLSKDIPSLVNKCHIRNHTHDSITPENMVKVLAGFLKTLSNKKLKNINSFNLQNQLQALPIILDYFIITFRAILSHFNVQKADDYNHPVKDSDSFIILSEYFDINFIRKDSFYLFEQYSFFIFKNFDEYVFGRYELFFKKPSSQQKAISELKQKYEDDRDMKIMECSMESGSYMVSSRHAEESTPYFNADGEQYIFRSNENKQAESSQKQDQSKSKSITDSKPENKCFQSKGSQFQVNIYTQQKSKFFNNRYKNPKNSSNSKNADSISDKAVTQINMHKDQNKKQERVFMSSNVPQHQKRFENPKKVHSDKQLSPTNSAPVFQKEKTDSEKTGKSNPTQQTQPTQNVSKDKLTPFQMISNECFGGKLFEWENQQRRLRRVQTICYKTCSTCHRRFYRNQIQSNVLEIKIDVIPKPQQVKEQFSKKPSFLPPKNPSDFLNKKFNRKPSQPVVEIPSSPRSNDQFVKNEQKQKSNAPQFSWLNKKAKTENGREKQKPNFPQLSPAGSPKNVDMNTPLAFKNVQSPKKVLSIKKLLVQNKESYAVTPSPDKNSNKQININENKRPSDETKQMPKIKSFFTLKSAKQLEKIKSIDKLDFFKDRITSLGTFKSDKALQITSNTTIKGPVLPYKNENKSPRDINIKQATKMRDFIAQRRVDATVKQQSRETLGSNKSPDKKPLRFNKKDSLNTALDLIMNS